jgi:hypothetical protein
MSEAIRFLHTFAQALSALMLYSPGHPATRRSIESAWQALGALLKLNDRPTFFFLELPRSTPVARCMSCETGPTPRASLRGACNDLSSMRR